MIFNFHFLLMAVLIGCFFIQLLYFFYFFLRLTFYQSPNQNEEDKPVSVIIAARNECENLRNHLPKLLKQDYRNFEVIVVNDRSWDSSDEILNDFLENFKNLKVVTIPDMGKDEFSKKFALTLGIKAAQNNVLLFTDADCFPSSNKWIKKMTQSISTEKMISIGAGPYEKEKGILNALIRFDAISIAVQYLSYALAGFPYMGVGRNLAYTKGIYNKVQGFKSHYHVSSGDDDLFINQAANSKNTQIIFDEKSITYSLPKQSFSNWVKQKSRHLETNHLYNFKTKILISIFPISLIFLYLSCCALLVLGIEPFYIFSIISLRGFIQIILFFRPLKIMGSKELVIFTPLLEFLLLIIYPFFYLNKFQNPS